KRERGSKRAFVCLGKLTGAAYTGKENNHTTTNFGVGSIPKEKKTCVRKFLRGRNREMYEREATSVPTSQFEKKGSGNDSGVFNYYFVSKKKKKKSGKEGRR
ncbi:hypothetical protein E2320_013919, partial [Naja naja]